jgi:hypothetical protein
MKNILYLFLSFQFFSTSINAQTWIDFRSAAGKFSVQFPVKPRETVDTTASVTGPYVTHLFISTSGNDIFMVGWVDYDSSFKFDTRAELLANRDNFAKALNAEIYETKDTSFKGHSGIEFTAGVSGLFIDSRVYIIGRRPYQIIAISKTGKSSPELQKFYASFSLNN